MPQMAPLNWLTLMIMFSLTLMMFNIMNYYSFQYNVKSSKIQSTKSNINWKW